MSEKRLWRATGTSPFTGKPDTWSLDVDGIPVATVWGNGTWHTWDHEGTGGENSVEGTAAQAMTEAVASVVRQHFCTLTTQASALTAANAEVERLRAKLVESREQVADWMLKANDNFWSVTRLQAELASARAERDAAREIVEAFKAWRAAWDTFHIETDSTRADWSGSRVNLASLKVSQTRQHLDALLVASLKGGK